MKVEANLKFSIPEDNEQLEMALYSSQTLQALKNIRAKVAFNLENEGGVPNQKRQVYAEINNLINDELRLNGVTHLF